MSKGHGENSYRRAGRQMAEAGRNEVTRRLLAMPKSGVEVPIGCTCMAGTHEGRPHFHPNAGKAFHEAAERWYARFDRHDEAGDEPKRRNQQLVIAERTA